MVVVVVVDDYIGSSNSDMGMVDKVLGATWVLGEGWRTARPRPNCPWTVWTMQCSPLPGTRPSQQARKQALSIYSTTTRLACKPACSFCISHRIELHLQILAHCHLPSPHSSLSLSRCHYTVRRLLCTLSPLRNFCRPRRLHPFAYSVCLCTLASECLPCLGVRTRSSDDDPDTACASHPPTQAEIALLL